MEIDSRVNPPRHVYHYTGPAGIAGIRASGVIRAQRTPLYGDLGFTELLRRTPPVVWLSINPMMEMTTLLKLGLITPARAVGRIYRVVLPYGYAGDLGLGEYTESVGIPEDDWLWSVRTGEMAGSNYTTWRLCPRDIPRADWLGIERFTGLDEEGFHWEPMP